MNEVVNPKYSTRELREIFDGFAKTAVTTIDNERMLVGHHVRVAWCEDRFGKWSEDCFDVWICNHRGMKTDQSVILGTGKRNNIISTLPDTIDVTIVDGEAWFSTTDLPWLKSGRETNLVALGIKKRQSPPKGGYRTSIPWLKSSAVEASVGLKPETLV